MEQPPPPAKSGDGIVATTLRHRALKIRRQSETALYFVRQWSSCGRVLATRTEAARRLVLSIEDMKQEDHFERVAALSDLEDKYSDHVFCRLVDRFFADDRVFVLRALPPDAIMYSSWVERNNGSVGPLPRIAYGLALALQELHARGLCFRYLPPLAVCVVDGAPMITDFPGLARCGVKMSVAGEAPHAAPETLRVPHRACESSDVWCLGALLLGAFDDCRKASTDFGELRRLMLAACLRLQPNLADVLYGCMRRRARGRCTVSQILSLTFG